MSRQITIPHSVNRLISTLQANGYEAYVVGGCVRDSLRGAIPSDWDVTTSATPEDVLRIFATEHTYAVGQQHGTIAVVLTNQTVEITTFRTDGNYSDHRRPDSVAFVTDIIEDLRRRDFTINAMAYNDQNGLVDPFEGQSDLENHILRCVGNPEKRFNEDALRILRGLRFSATLGFRLEPQTAAALQKKRKLLRSVAVERIQAELTRLLCGQNAFDVLRDYRDVFAVVIPQLLPMFDLAQHNPHHIHDVYLHSLYTMQNVPREPILRWAALLHDIGKPACKSIDSNGIGHFHGHAQISAETARTALQNLKFDSNTICKVTELVRMHDNPLLPTDPSVKRMLNRVGEEQTRRLIALKKVDCSALSPDFHDRIVELEAVERVLDTILLKDACFSLRDLSVKGNDITALGVSSGPAVGRILHILLDEVIDGICENDREHLLQRAAELVREEFV